MEMSNEASSDVIIQGNDIRMDTHESTLDDFGNTGGLIPGRLAVHNISVSSNKCTDNYPHPATPVYKKHQERNISLRHLLFEKTLKPAARINVKKVDRLSQNLSNSQIAVQDALFQARMSTSNLNQLHLKLVTFGFHDFLKDIRIESEIDNLVEMDDQCEGLDPRAAIPL